MDQGTTSRTFSYAEKDPEFERWTFNLLSTFINTGQLKQVSLNDSPDFLFVTSTSLRVNPDLIDCGIPLILMHNESWSNYWPPCGPEKFHTIIGCCPIDWSTFIQYPYYSVHFDAHINQLLLDRKKYLEKPKTKFCCFVTSNDFCGHSSMVLKRIDLFDELCKYKTVDSAGKVRNNMRYLAPRKDFIEWVSDYKFMICLENTKSTPGYLTEKPFTPWFAGTVPIYDGVCASELNPKAFVNASGDIKDIVQSVMDIDKHQPLYELMRHETIMENIVDKFSLKEFERQFREKVLDS